MDDATFDKIARNELSYIEEQFMEVDPDEVEVSSSDGVITLELRDGVRIVINSHRAARQIWMAAVADAWHFNYNESDKLWRTSESNPAELRATLKAVIKKQLGLDVPL
ncbi:MAG: iron donor protein CyaY [Proteobacteria bacterium]|nr:iron donor protein CyaY [Pseudomonadota bacterium]